ncbi:efflux RND transporter permease subunit [Escherichia coli]
MTASGQNYRSCRKPFRRDIDLQIAQDQLPTIRASLEEVEQTLIISVALVILVVFLFLRSGHATIIPAVSVPVSLIGRFGDVPVRIQSQ